MKLSKKNQDSKMAEIIKEFGEKWEATINARKDTLGQCTSCIAWEIGEKIENNITCVCDKLNLDNFNDVDWCDKSGCYFEELKNKPKATIEVKTEREKHCRHCRHDSDTHAICSMGRNNGSGIPCQYYEEW